ncbi:MAG: hypothetical protein ACD_2C00051G0001 [uncultured bacterium (gcode 4)]|uniref:Uncharacterized protein n=1 Tax=uncultured bacterium (gcode 4) TaxID=1234023 RepID=K2H2F7_9BACT|nr:MAG: hypothetical protein ACD_2C00051G0001 [uncultured bacterium (gcode 4)]
MFKGRIYVYKNVNWKKEELSKEFDNEKSFNEFIEMNPSLKEFNELKVWDFKWPRSLFDLRSFFEDAELLWEKKWIKETEKELDKIFEKTNKLLR